MKQREEWRKRFAGGENLLTQNEGLSRVDQQFLEKIEHTLSRHFEESTFGVENLAQAVAMSKTHLNRKLNALLDTSANKLIQDYRLQKAREFLQAKDGNVSEIALACGFNSTAYFVKCFKERYQVTPGTILQ